MADRLPYELRSLIFSSVHKHDIPNLRLASKAWAAASYQHLSIGEHFYFRKHSLERLEQIAKHPVMSQIVKRLTFIVDVVAEFSNKLEWERQVRAKCHVQWFEADLSTQDSLKGAELCTESDPRTLNRMFVDAGDLDYEIRELGWPQQLLIRAEQKALLADPLNTFESIRHSFSKLTRLKTFKISALGEGAAAPVRPLHILSPMQSWYCYNEVRGTEGFDDVSIRIFLALLESRGHRCGSDVAALPLEDLYINASEFGSFHDESVPQLWAQPTVLQNLTSIRLTSFKVCGERHLSHEIDDPFDNDENGPFLCHLLKNLPRLQYLGLYLLKFDNIYDLVDMDNVFTTCVWPELETLNLATSSIKTEVFLPFLSRHAKTLRTLILSEVHITSGGVQQRWWIQWLKFMQKNLTLDYLLLAKWLTEGSHIYFSPIRSVERIADASITVMEAARYLVCGVRPPGTRGDGQVDELLRTLTWDDLAVAYGQ